MDQGLGYIVLHCILRIHVNIAVQMFKAVYFHKTVKSTEVMLLHSILLAYDSINFNVASLDNYLSLTDETIIIRILASKGNSWQGG